MKFLFLLILSLEGLGASPVSHVTGYFLPESAPKSLSCGISISAPRFAILLSGFSFWVYSSHPQHHGHHPSPPGRLPELPKWISPSCSVKLHHFAHFPSILVKTYLLDTYYVLGTLLDSGCKKMKKTKVLTSSSSQSQWGDTQREAGLSH